MIGLRPLRGLCPKRNAKKGRGKGGRKKGRKKEKGKEIRDDEKIKFMMDNHVVHPYKFIISIQFSKSF
jgi:hypothetical protein